MKNNSPTSLEAGSHADMQNFTNLDVSRFWKDYLSGVNLAWGLEHRLENFQVQAGEEGSWGLYNTNGDLVSGVPDEELVVKDYFRRTRPGGAQVFPGFRPENELNRSRNSMAAYTIWLCRALCLFAPGVRIMVGFFHRFVCHLLILFDAYFGLINTEPFFRFV